MNKPIYIKMNIENINIENITSIKIEVENESKVNSVEILSDDFTGYNNFEKLVCNELEQNCVTSLIKDKELRPLFRQLKYNLVMNKNMD